MIRSAGILVFVLAVIPTTASQSVPKELLSAPARLELDKHTTEVKVGSTVTYTVTLKNSGGQTVDALSNLALEIETPSGHKTVVLTAGQSSANFTWEALSSGIVHMTVRSGKLRPATGLVLVTPSPKTALVFEPSLPRSVDTVSGRRAPTSAHAPGDAVGGLAGAPPPPPSAASAPASSLHPTRQARKIQLYIEPIPVYGSAVDHSWKTTVSVAALDDQNSLAPVSADVPIHLTSSSGSLSPTDIVLSTGQFSNFEKPVVLTANRSGKSIVDAVSFLGPAGPVEVEYLQPPPQELRLSLGTPVLTGTGSSTTSVQACLLDESGAITVSDQATQVTLTATGQLASPLLTIQQGSVCSNSIIWTSGSGSASIKAEASGLTSDTESITFPSFPWYFVLLAAVGGLVGTLISSSGDLFSARWWSYTWRGLVLGAMLGVVFYLFARFGAIALPKDSPVNIQNIPVVSGIGSLLLGFLGGLYGSKLWRIDKDKLTNPPVRRQVADGGDGNK